MLKGRRIAKAITYDMESGDLEKFRFTYNPKIQAEYNVIDYYQDLGYKVYRLTSRGGLSLDESDIGKAIKKFGNQIRISLRINNNIGIPDLVVFSKRKGELFLVEVKTKHDSIRIHQFEWWVHSKIPVKVFIIDRVKWRI